MRLIIKQFNNKEILIVECSTKVTSLRNHYTQTVAS